MAKHTKHFSEAPGLIASELNNAQIEALAEFYRSWTGKDPRLLLVPDSEQPADPDYLSPGVPEGYETVLGFLARHQPHILELLEGFAEATQRDGWWLMGQARARGLRMVKVEACRFLIQQGIFEVNAYPLHLLAERFPVDG